MAPTLWGMPNAPGVYFREEERRRTPIYTDLSPPYDLFGCQRAPGKLHSTAPLGFCKGEDLGPRRVGKCAICLVLEHPFFHTDTQLPIQISPWKIGINIPSFCWPSPHLQVLKSLGMFFLNYPSKEMSKASMMRY